MASEAAPTEGVIDLTQGAGGWWKSQEWSLSVCLEFTHGELAISAASHPHPRPWRTKISHAFLGYGLPRSLDLCLSDLPFICEFVQLNSLLSASSKGNLFEKSNF